MASTDSITLSRPPALRKNVAAMPLIRNPKSAEEQRINQDLSRIDVSMRSALVECDKDYSEHAKALKIKSSRQWKQNNWTRSVEVTTAGPHYLSYLITDSNLCGGAHENFSESALVYDLETGLAVNWIALLPAGESKLQPEESSNNIPAQEIAGKSLQAFYAGRLKDEDCRKIVGEDDNFSLLIWPDAKLHKLVFGTNLRHVIEACAEHVVLSADEARQLGFSDTLLQSIEMSGKR